ncbi:MAG: single-stranded-DNA-specific exonuclease RecJ [Patescibacteria group bacterium]
MTVFADIVDTLLLQRGVSDADKDSFLNPDFVRDTHDPFLLEGMHKAVDRILVALGAGERIAVYADFDCDGIPGAVVMHDFFKKVGHTAFEVYIPHRHTYGHGFHKAAIDDLKERGVSLIITIDVGVTAVETAAYAKEKGIDVIITDHHEPPDILPEAVAVINPKLGTYPFRDLCGAAVGFKVVQAVLAEGGKQGVAACVAVPEGWEKWLLDMVGIATVADMVPLVGENRALARFGLFVLRKSPRLGIHALCRKARLDQRRITEDDIGFSFAPRINASSRMDCPELAFQLLATSDPAEAENLAAQLEKLNAQRKGVVASLVKEVRKIALERYPTGDVVILGNPEWKPALLGLAANSVVEDRGGIVCLWGRDGSGALKGSCRSDGSINVVEMFKVAQGAGTLEESGGHACAGGFSMSSEQVHRVSELLGSAAEQVRGNAIPVDPQFDAEITVGDISAKLLDALALLAPFGIANPKPVFRTTADIRAVKVFGKEGNHTEVMVGLENVTVRAFEFFKTPDNFTVPPRVGERQHILVTVEKDSFRGPRAVALRIVDVLPFVSH